MGRIAGRNGRVYLGIASSAANAEPLPFVASWSISHSTSKSAVTAMGDVGKTYVSGLPDATGSFKGFYDDASAQTYTAATDGQPRKFYLYPSTLLATQYWFGTVLPDITVNSDVDGAVEMSADWAAAGIIQKVG